MTPQAKFIKETAALVEQIKREAKKVGASLLHGSAPLAVWSTFKTAREIEVDPWTGLENIDDDFVVFEYGPLHLHISDETDVAEAKAWIREATK